MVQFGRFDSIHGLKLSGEAHGGDDMTNQDLALLILACLPLALKLTEVLIKR